MVLVEMLAIIGTFLCLINCLSSMKSKAKWKLRADRLSFEQDEETQSSTSSNNFTEGTATMNHVDVIVKRHQMGNIGVTHQLSNGLNKLLSLEHPNICKFYGAMEDRSSLFLVGEYCTRGTLHELLHNSKYDVDDVFRESLLHDLVSGLMYLHKSPIKFHGNLTTKNCLIDSRFVLKLSCFAMLESTQRQTSSIEETPENNYEELLYRCPEDLRQERPIDIQPSSDIYSLALVMHEIYYERGAFYVGPENKLSVTEKLESIKEISSGNPFRPTLVDDDDVVIETSRKKLIARCWSENPKERPSIGKVKEVMRIHDKEKNLIDHLILRLEQYSSHLEEQVEDRTNQLKAEKERADGLLYQMLPKTIAEKLKKGQIADCESFDCVTIYFSDIVGFTSISHNSTAHEVVALLNDLYTMFDEKIDNFDVYKVETIGDAYMVVSGLPERNGNKHAEEIAKMSLELLDDVTNQFEIRHMPDTKLKIRIGLHSGPVVTGVVGTKMPRYCLFGDTVNTAARMESSGEALKIHVSPKTKQILDGFKTFNMQARKEEVELKGLGNWQTYWLLSDACRTSTTKSPPARRRGSVIPGITPLGDDQKMSFSTLTENKNSGCSSSVDKIAPRKSQDRKTLRKRGNSTTAATSMIIVDEILKLKGEEDETDRILNASAKEMDNIPTKEKKKNKRRFSSKKDSGVCFDNETFDDLDRKPTF